MANFFGNDYTLHGDTHLRTVKKYSAAAIQPGFDQFIENLLDAVNHLQILQPPVTAAIDITTWPYPIEDDLPAEVSGTKRTDETAYKFATLSLVGKSMPIVLAYASVIESSEEGRQSTGISLSNTVPIREIFGVERSNVPVHNWVHKADLQPEDRRSPDHVAVDEIVIRLNDEQYWLYAAVDPETELLHAKLELTRTNVIAHTFFAELREKHGRRVSR